jgi:hypothetical protein
VEARASSGLLVQGADDELLVVTGRGLGWWQAIVGLEGRSGGELLVKAWSGDELLLEGEADDELWVVSRWSMAC